MFAFSAYMPHVRYILTNWWKQFFFVKMIGEKTAFSIGRVVSSGAFRISDQLSRHHRPDTSFYVLYLVSLYKTKKKRWKERKEKVQSLQLYCPSGISLVENSGCLPRGKPAATESRYPTYGACLVFECFRNPPNADMEYGIFNVRTYVNECDCTRGCTDTVRESALKGN